MHEGVKGGKTREERAEVKVEEVEIKGTKKGRKEKEEKGKNRIRGYKEGK